MRDYGKVAPGFWTGKTGKALKAKGPEAVIVALYLVTCQHANMLGLYYLSKTYIAVDTPLGFEGACKGLQGACEAGFCRYDEDSEVVWVVEMAEYQIAEQLDPKDNRCKGIQREYDALPENPFLAPFYERYAKSFHMTSMRGEPPKKERASKAPRKPLRSQEQEQEQEQEQKQEQEGEAPRKRVAPPAIPRPDDVCESVWRDWTALRAKKRTTVSETAIEGAREEAAKAGLCLEAFLRIWVTRGSQGMEAAWIKPEERRAAQSFAERDREAGMQRWEEMTGRVHPDRQQQPGAVVIDLPPHQPIAIGGRS